MVRFDRHGDHGRSAVSTLGSLNPALIGTSGAPWHKIAMALRGRKWLSHEDVARVARIWWFGKLIANSDMHEGNLAFRPGFALAPIYDMLPMMYAPMRGGEVPERAYSPALPFPGDMPAWTQAAMAATHYWEICTADARISDGFRRVCGSNAGRLAELLAH